MRLARRLLALLLAMPLIGCSAADLVNSLTSRRGYDVLADVQYGPQPRQRMDVYRPDIIRPDMPTVVFLYGGNWDSGDKEDYLFVGQALASRGYVAAIPNYRLYPEVRFPEFVEDAAAAVAWLARRPSWTEVSSRPVVLLGHSAGAQIAMLLALDERYLEAAGATVCASLQAAIGLAGPYDFLPLEEDRYRRIFPEATRAASQPIAFADASAPPILLLVGKDDETVDPGNSSRLAAQLQAAGGRVQLTTYDGIGHTGLIGALAGPLRGRAPVLQDIDAFVSAQIGRKAPFC